MEDEIEKDAIEEPKYKILEEEKTINNEKYTILSIDGGGIRGLVPAILIAYIEDQLKCKARDVFDMFSGSSTGGIISLGLAYGMSAADLVTLYETKADDIFEGHRYKGSWSYKTTKFEALLR